MQRFTMMNRLVFSIALAGICALSNASLLRSSYTEQLTCRITKVDTLYDFSNTSIWSEEELVCIPIENGIENDDTLHLDLPDELQIKYAGHFEAGNLCLNISGVKTDDTQVFLTDATEFSECALPSHLQRRLEVTGTKTFSVVRISTSDASPTNSLTDLKNGFKTSGTNLITQYDDCSFGQLKWEFKDAYDVKVNQPVSNFKGGLALVTAAQKQMKSQLNLAAVSGLADKVLMCLPPGTGDWVASAGVNHWRAQFNNDWCLSLTANMHGTFNRVFICVILLLDTSSHFWSTLFCFSQNSGIQSD